MSKHKIDLVTMGNAGGNACNWERVLVIMQDLLRKMPCPKCHEGVGSVERSTYTLYCLQAEDGVVSDNVRKPEIQGRS